MQPPESPKPSSERLHAHHSAYLLPYGLILAAGVLWGLTFSLARIATEQNAHPVGLAFWQALGGGIFLLMVCVTRGTPPSFDGRAIRDYCVVALLGTAIPATMYFYAVPHIPVGVLAITVAMVPMLTYGLSLGLRVEGLSVRRVTGLLLGFAAVVFLVAPETSLPRPEASSWLLLALLASVFYAGETIYVEIYVGDESDMIPLLMAALMIAAVAFAPLLFAMDAFVPISFPLDRSEWAIIAMALFSSVAYVMFFYVIKHSGAVFASVTGYVITLCGVLWGILLFDEAHSAWVWAALILMLLGMTMVRPKAHSV